MLVSLEWLGQYVDLKGLSPNDIAEALTQSGLEVESIQQVGGNFSGVKVGKILAVDPHPNADRLRLVTVNLGAETPQVVCGAPNVAPDLFIAFAPVGAQVVNRKDNTPFVLEKAKIRGIESCGMICSLDELGLLDLYPKTEDGIWSLEGLVSDSVIGQELKTALNLQADTILEIAPTANRGDQMSMIGVAREVAALFDRDLHLPKVTPLHAMPGPQHIQVHLTDAEVCQYYGGAILHNVKVGPSPEWMVRRLQAAGVRSINNVVDITNYVMLETGQPLHAFDKEKFGYAGEVNVCQAQAGEILVTLDGVKRELAPESVVVTMNKKPVALAGLMGGEETEVGDTSKNIFLESAYFTPATNRRSAKSVGLRTEASARFERGVDAGACRTALFAAVELLTKHAGAEFVNLVESPVRPQKEVDVLLRIKRIERVLGLSIEKEMVLKALKKLGFLFKPVKEADKLMVSVPSFRQHDVSREIDLIEEIVRIYGYDKVPYTLPRETASVAPSFRRQLLNQFRSVMAGAGLQEVVTTSLIGESLLEKTGFSIDRKQVVMLSNSHSEEHTMMRQSLLPNLLEIAKFNQAQGLEDVWIYELGRTYFKKGQASEKQTGVVEKLCLSGLMTGAVGQGEWHLKAATDFYAAKGALEALAKALGIDGEFLFEAETELAYLHPGKTARILLKAAASKRIGSVGELHPSLQNALKFRHPVYLFELDVDALYQYLKQQDAKPKQIKISTFPAVKRDIAFLAEDGITHQKVLEVLKSLDEPLMRHIELFDEYRGEKLGAGKRSLAYRVTLQSDEETLTDEQIDAAVTRLKAALTQKLSVTLR